MNLNDTKECEVVLSKICDKMRAVVKRNHHKLPYSTVDGVFDDYSDDANIGWWTNGFWGGILWQLYNVTKEPMFFDEAGYQEVLLDRVFMNWSMLDHDNGFRWLPTSAAAYQFNKNEKSLNRIMLAANNFLGRFNINGNYFRAWNDFNGLDNRGIAIIDCMMNLPLLYLASDLTNDRRFYDAAYAHAVTAARDFIRDDGSVVHIVRYDNETGKFIETLGGQGVEVGSSWTRGQAWGLYGFVLSYIHTKNVDFLNTSKKIADYIISELNSDFIVPVDYRQPKDVKYSDSSAAAITASGLISLYRETKDEKYLNTAVKLLESLLEHDADFDINTDSILNKCSAKYHDDVHEFSIIYGDYYFIEAIFKLLNKELFIW